MVDDPKERRPRIDPSLIERIDSYCRAERRNFTAAVNVLIAQALTEYEAALRGESKP